MKKLLIAASLAALSAFPTLAQAREAPHPVQITHVETTRVQPNRVVQRNFYSVNGHRYEAQRTAWVAPRGFHRQSFRNGQMLDRELRRSNVSYQALHLPRPARGQTWVRVDRDVLLINANGRIAAIISGVFY